MSWRRFVQDSLPPSPAVAARPAGDDLGPPLDHMIGVVRRPGHAGMVEQHPESMANWPCCQPDIALRYYITLMGYRDATQFLRSIVDYWHVVSTRRDSMA